MKKLSLVVVSCCAAFWSKEEMSELTLCGKEPVVGRMLMKKQADPKIVSRIVGKLHNQICSFIITKRVLNRQS